MPESESLRIADLLDRKNGGDVQAGEKLFRLLYDELRRRAQTMLNGFKPGQTLQATALVHEAFIKLAGDSERLLKGRDHYMALMSRAMRQVLLDSVKSKNRLRRGGGNGPVQLDTSQLGVTDHSPDVLDIDAALKQLATLDERQGSIAEMRLFGEMELKQIANVLQVSLRTVEGEWAMARSTLRGMLIAT